MQGPILSAVCLLASLLLSTGPSVASELLVGAHSRPLPPNRETHA